MPREEAHAARGTCLASIRRVLHRPHALRADHRAAPRRGFSMLEVVVTIGIIATLAALSVGAYDRIVARADFSSVLANLVTSVRQTRSEAAGRGVATAFVVDTVNNRWWGVEAPLGWSIAAFDPNNPGTVIVSDTFPTGNGKAVFGPTAGYGAALPAPFRTVPVISSQAPSLPYCSFCDRGTGLGAIVFQPNGTASFGGNVTSATALGQQFTIQSAGDGRTVLLAVIARTGVVEVFER